METINNPNGNYTYISLLANQWIALKKTRKGNVKVLSKTLETDKNIAEAIAKNFAERHKIPFCNKIIFFDHLVYTICRQQDTDNWYPACMWFNGMKFLYDDGPGFTKKNAQIVAKALIQHVGSGTFFEDCNIVKVP